MTTSNSCLFSTFVLFLSSWCPFAVPWARQCGQSRKPIPGILSSLTFICQRYSNQTGMLDQSSETTLRVPPVYTVTPEQVGVGQIPVTLCCTIVQTCPVSLSTHSSREGSPVTPEAEGRSVAKSPLWGCHVNCELLLSLYIRKGNNLSMLRS